MGDRTKVWHHTHIRAGARIGCDSVLGKGVYVAPTVVVGNRVHIQNNVSLYDGVSLEDDVFIGPGAVFANDRQPRAHNLDWRPEAVIIRRGASVGAHATILPGLEIGEYAMIGAGTVVTRSVLPHQLVVGVPARAYGWICRCGSTIRRQLSRPERFGCETCGSDDVDQR